MYLLYQWLHIQNSFSDLTSKSEVVPESPSVQVDVNRAEVDLFSVESCHLLKATRVKSLNVVCLGAAIPFRQGNGC